MFNIMVLPAHCISFNTRSLMLSDMRANKSHQRSQLANCDSTAECSERQKQLTATVWPYHFPKHPGSVGLVQFACT